MAQKKFYVDIATQTNVRIKGDAVQDGTPADGGDKLVTENSVVDYVTGLGYSTFNGTYGALTGVPTTFAPAAHNHAASDINSGTFTDSRIAESNVTQHEDALSIDWSQLASIPATFTPAAHNHAADEITSGTFANARIAQSNVTQHQAALSITESQISDLSHFDGAFGSLTSVPELAQMYKKTFSGSPTTVTATMPSATAAANAVVQVIDNNFDVIECAIDRTAASADIVINFDVAVTGGTILITSYDGSISTNSL